MNDEKTAQIVRLRDTLEAGRLVELARLTGQAMFEMSPGRYHYAAETFGRIGDEEGKRLANLAAGQECLNDGLYYLAAIHFSKGCREYLATGLNALLQKACLDPKEILMDERRPLAHCPNPFVSPRSSSPIAYSDDFIGSVSLICEHVNRRDFIGAANNYVKRS